MAKRKHNTVKHSKDNALEVHEQGELRRAIDNLKVNELTKERYRVLIALCMDIGLRISEAIQVRHSWVLDTDDGITLNIPKKARDIRNLKRDWIPKSESGARELIFLDPRIGAMVKSYLLNNNDNKTRLGLGFSRQRAGQIVKELGIAINKPLLHPHALRSTCANNLVYAGVNVTTLQYYMGWANIETAVCYVRTSKIAARKDLLNRFKK